MQGSNSANVGFEAKLFQAADKLRSSMDASEYKHVVLGLVFLKHISDAFGVVYEKLAGEEYADEEDPEEYLAERTFWVPKEARWSYLQNNAKQPTIGKLVDDAMLAIEKSNNSLKGVLPTDYAREALNKQMLGELIDLIGTIETLASAQACGICSPTHSVVDTSGTLSLQIGNTFIDLSKVSDDGQLHELSGYFYETTGQCGIGECTLFAVEQLDQQQIAAPIYDAVNEKLSIETVVTDTVDQGGFSVTLDAPFNVSSAIEITE